jgi:hypothetical protein
MDMPKPGPAHEKLKRLVGEWTGSEHLKPSPWDPVGGDAVGRVNNRLALDGFAVVQDYEQERLGAIGFRGHGVFRWDEAEKQYLLYWFDSTGQSPGIFRGTFDDDILSLESSNVVGHARATFDFGTADAYRYRMEVSPDAEVWYPFMEGTYRRISST